MTQNPEIMESVEIYRKTYYVSEVRENMNTYNVLLFAYLDHTVVGISHLNCNNLK